MLLAIRLDVRIEELFVIVLNVMVLPCMVENHMLLAIRLEVWIEELFVMVLVIMVLPCINEKL